MRKTFLNKSVLSLFFICIILLSIVFSLNQNKVFAQAVEAFISLGQGSKLWTSISVDSSNHNVYATSQYDDIYKQTGGLGNFIPLGQGYLGWVGISVDSSNQNVYAVDSDNFDDIYKQTGGVGNFQQVSISIPAGNLTEYSTLGLSPQWISVAVDSSNHNVYILNIHGIGNDIYKQTGGVGVFEFIARIPAVPSKGIFVDSSNHNVYVVSQGSGDIYKQTGGAGSFLPLGLGPKDWTSISIDSSNNNVYATALGDDIYKQTGGAGSLLPLGQTSRNWQGVSVDSLNHNVYAVVLGGDIYKMTADVGGCENFTWTSRVSSADNLWASVTYGNGLFVAVSYSGSGNRVMTSPDGINWTPRVNAVNNNWTSVTYANGLFVAVADSGSGNRVMTSPDGINWTSRSSSSDSGWRSVTYGNGLFVAVAEGYGNLVMTSPDGINWTNRNAPYDNLWMSVTYGNGLFVAVAPNGDINDIYHHVMTSPNGINWTSRTSASNNAWQSVTYGNGLFVAVSYSGSGNRVMTSPDGINWTSRVSSADSVWRSVTYGNGLFVAVASNGGINSNVMTSPDGINWTNSTSASNNSWTAVTYGDSQFVAVSNNGTGNRVMTGNCSPTGELIPFTPSCVISLGESSCNIDFSWATTNPIGNSAITKPVNITVAPGDSCYYFFEYPGQQEGKCLLSVKYNSETFYLYNNATLLDQSTVTSSCISGTTWNGIICAGPASPTIVGPFSGNTDINYTYTILDTNPGSYNIRYGVDWKNSSGVPYSSTDTMDGVADIWLPASGYVAPGTGQDTTLIWTTAGVKKFQALIQNEWGINSAWTIDNITIDSVSCPNCSLYISQVVPYRTAGGLGSVPQAGQPFTAEVTMKNVGTNTWTGGTAVGSYRLASQAGSTWGASVSMPDGTTIAPDSSHTFTISGTAPSTPNIYSFQWKMEKRTGSSTYLPFDEVTPNISVDVISPPPPTPTGLSVFCGALGTEATLSWNPSAYATSYFLRYYQTSGSPSSYSTQISPFFTNIIANVNYTWNVYASNSTGDSSVASGTFTCPNTSTVTVVNINPITGGKVVDESSQINCGSTCSGTFTEDSTVILQAIPNSSYWQFNGWGGDCASAGNNFYCSLYIDANKSASATFITRLFNYGEF